MTVSEALQTIVGPLHGLSTKELTEDIWNELVTFLENREKKIHVVKLGNGAKSDATIPQEDYSAWQLYRKKLKSQNWSEDSIDNIKKSSYEILQNLSMETVDDGPVKGLVIGNVQSGKTANMAGLMAMAADNGFNYFIILSGVIENLRQQTSSRLYSDMNSSGHGNLHWHQVDKPSLKSKLPEHNISQFNLGSKDKDRYFTVSLKNKGRLNSLIKWLFSDSNKAKQLKVLVIDDEADQASVNTKNIEDEDSTAINECIKKLVNTTNVKGMNYISYTATPYANILNETSEESLYPKDFIILLEPSEDYIGPKQLFGTELPEMSPFIDIVRDITKRDEEIVREIQNGSLLQSLPQSFVKSIHWFILTVGAMRANDYHKPISMLIHTSFKISHHEIIGKKVNEYLRYMRANYEEIIPRLHEMYEDESLDFKRSYFLDGLKNYSTPEEVPDYPEWQVIERYIDRLFRLTEDEFVSHINIGEEGQPVYHKGIHLAIDNSQSKADNQIMRLVYPSKEQMPNIAPAFIVIGGNTLSRGLTLEGLTTTYFLRTTNQADTLMQMGRWFGYRKGYEIFPRVWLDRLALERFQFLSQMNEELREEIGVYAEKGLTPIGYAPRIKNSSNYQLIRITSNNKMQSAEAKEFDFAGFNTQTIYFENDQLTLENNLKQTNKFLNSLMKPEVKNNHMIWRDVDVDQVKEFLEVYKVCNSDTKMSGLPALIEWAQKNSEKLSKWSVVLSSVGSVAETKGIDSEWNIHGYSPKTVRRTKLKNRSQDNLVSIGALRTPTDLLADIDEILSTEEKKVAKPSEVQAVREKYGYGKVPQIIIYRIDKGEMSEEEYLKMNPKRKNRMPLNFLAEPIGINIMIPGETKGGNTATYISASIDIDRQNINESDYEEEIDHL
ncbi:TPA: Z1 domain-containing protein [Listeria monocytogenes]|nr:hypothetical protein [Listeria monocytogenes]HDI4828567.1 Z1 domain-containing protein [Listeria monocytogenes]HDM9928148.1 Z1 domain-containing protein [Listeria monocytogenes]